MKSIASKAIASMALACAGVFGLPAESRAQDVIPDGLYTVNAHHFVGYYEYAGCMIISNNGQDWVPSLYYWSLTNKNCGLYDNNAEMVAHRQAVWRVSSVVGSNGVRRYALKSHVNGMCLIRGDSGLAANPSLYLWSLPGGKPEFCGFRTADEMIQNGQASWELHAQNIDGASWVYEAVIASGMLGFAPTPPIYPNTWDRYVWAALNGPTHYEFELRPMQ